jgi:sugar (pentulose or hexulose) kinase
MALFIGIDSGTQSTKAVVLDLEARRVIADARAPHQLIDGLPVGHMEQHPADWTKALDLYQRSRVARTARIVLSSREMGRIYHAKGVERLVRNDLWKGRTPERFYDAMEWLYSWRVETCLDPTPAPA